MDREKLMDYIIELQFIAQTGLAYSSNVFDIERFQRLREISAEMLSGLTDEPLDFVREVFCSEKGFQTPKLDCRGAVIEDDKILLVQETDGRWALPGGWVDVNQTIKNNLIKEMKEEAGLDVEAGRLVAILDRNRHNSPRYIYNIAKVFILCKSLGGEFVENIETLQRGYFTYDDLPELATEKTSREQIKMCLEAHRDSDWKVIFD